MGSCIVYEELKVTLSNRIPMNYTTIIEDAQRKSKFSKVATNCIRNIIVSPCKTKKQHSRLARKRNISKAFPEVQHGRELMLALSKRMSHDSMTESNAWKMTMKLPDEFLRQLNLYTMRSSELLKHFFVLRNFLDDNQKCDDDGVVGPNMSLNGSSTESFPFSNINTTENPHKLLSIVEGMELVYEEIENMRKEVPKTELGETMRKMCLPIMEQLDSAFKLHRGELGGFGIGFVSVN